LAVLTVSFDMAADQDSIIMDKILPVLKQGKLTEASEAWLDRELLLQPSVLFLTSFVFSFADEHNDGGGPMYMLQAYAPFKVVAFR
jgi:hypothetical protein